MTEDGGEPLLRAEGLEKYYDTSESFLDTLLGFSRQVKAVDGVDLELHDGETLGVVGESGCGKTTLGRALLRLEEPTDGAVYYRGENLLAKSSQELRELRKDLQYIFQDPFASLNPRLTVGDIIGEPLDVHDIATGEARQERIFELLETVGLNPSHTHRYPHEFSGGQRQRIGIARALAVDPEVIVCDEPVSALDVSVQAQILNLLEDLQAEFGLSYVFIAHDLSVVEHIADRIGVMYLGEFAEVGTTREVFDPPYHPYTEALLSAIPEPDPGWEGEQILLTGTVPSPIDPPSGCRFHTRCPQVIQPEGLDLDQAVWRALMDMKVRMAHAESVHALTAIADEGGLEATHATDTLEEPTRLDPAEFDHRVREEFELPERIGDPEVRTMLADVVDHLHDGDLAAASDRLADVVSSPCEREDPARYDTGGTHDVACLRFDERFPDEPPGWTGPAGHGD